MSLHQIIYTSCKRGIDGLGDGQQIFSYNEDFKDANSSYIKKLFYYKAPELQPGIAMTDEIALNFPRSFTFKRLEDGRYALILNTFLGRDYMGDDGRFNNTLSHVVIFDENDIENYPCEFYASPLLRDYMEKTEVNNDKKPEYLDTPTLERGFWVSMEAVVDFLNESEERIEIYKNMVHAMLLYKTHKKRVLICDEPNNIIMWISALHYVMPLKSALNINCTTYEYDPALSDAQICGVVSSGTNYDVKNSNNHFVFDFFENKFEQFEKDENFYEFIDTAIVFSHESVKAFHNFIKKYTIYDKADVDIYDAFTIYTFITDDTVDCCDLAKMQSALKFAKTYGSKRGKVSLFKFLIRSVDYVVNLPREKFMVIADYLVYMIDKISENRKKEVVRIFILRVFEEYNDTMLAENEFEEFFKYIQVICSKYGTTIEIEIVKEEIRVGLLQMLKNGIQDYNLLKIVRIACNYERNVQEVSDYTFINTLVGQIVYVACSNSSEDAMKVSNEMINQFADDSYYLLHLVFDLEITLCTFGHDDYTYLLWEKFFSIMSQRHINKFEETFNILKENDRYDLLFDLYKVQMHVTNDPQEIKNIFVNQHLNMQEYEMYATDYYQEVLSVYYYKLKSFDNSVVDNLIEELLYHVYENEVESPFILDLIDVKLQKFLYKKLSENEQIMVNTLYDYFVNRVQEPLPNKLSMLIVGLVLDSIKEISTMYEYYDKIKTPMNNGKIDLTMLENDEVARFFDWILPNCGRLFKKSDDVALLLDLIKVSEKENGIMFEKALNYGLTFCNQNNDYGVLCELFKFIFENTYEEEIVGINKIINKLSKPNFNTLDKEIRNYFENDEISIKKWESIIANNSKDINIKNISNLFKKRKD